MSKTIEIRVTASQNQWLPYANQPPPSLAEIDLQMSSNYKMQHRFLSTPMALTKLTVQMS